MCDFVDRPLDTSLSSASPDGQADIARAWSISPASAIKGQQHWRGKSGRLYSARPFGLLACIAPVRGVYVLVTRTATGEARALAVGAAASAAPTSNLARIRRRAAQLGASEVHLIDLTHTTGSYAARRLARDLRAGIGHSARF